MVVCPCGQFTEDASTLCPRCEALHVLGLGTEALENEIRSAYRLLSKAWQPEDFADDPKLKESAEAKLHDIHTAFDFLTMTSTDRVQAQRPVYLSAKLPAEAAVPLPTSDAQALLGANTLPATAATPNPTPTSAPLPAAPPQEPPQTPPTPGNHKLRNLVALLALALILAFGMLIRTAWNVRDSFAGPASSAAGKTPINSLVAPLAQLMNKIDPPPAAPQNPATGAQAATPEANQPAGTHAHSDAKSQQQGKANAAAYDPQAGMPKLKPYVTVGSTREEVIALEGAPTASSDEKLVYGRSELYLKNNTVAGWHIDPASPVRVKLWPRVFVDPALDFFSVGSTKDEVLKIQGTPATVTEDRFEYGGAIVYFSNNRVVRWKSDPSSVTLWAR